MAKTNGLRSKSQTTRVQRPAKNTEARTSVTSTKHPKDKRVNIPTKELKDFMAEDERKPKTLLYPRDPSLDPQLVWKGKDEQDAQDLAVQVVPVYVQEKIQPQAIIENIRAEAKQDAPAQMQMFSDFNGLAFEDMVDFYHHEQKWTNRMILGDSQLVMASLAEKEGLKGKVQMIYLDPPYGISFGSNWQTSTRKRDVRDSKAEDVTRQPEQIKAFRDTWELGVHSYLAYLRERLVIARDLLSESGSVFVQIGDANVHYVRCVLEEVFGVDNFMSVITIQKTGGTSGKFLKSVSDYVLWFAKNIEFVKYRQLYLSKVGGDESNPGKRYDQIQLPDGSRRALTLEEKDEPALAPAGARIYQLTDLTSNSGDGASILSYDFQGENYTPPYGRGWSTNLIGRERLRFADRVVSTGKRLMFRRFLDDYPAYTISNVWRDAAVTPDVVYVVQTHPVVIHRCMLMTTDPGDLVLDPTCGSGTTAYVAEQWGRRWITIDTSRVAVALARTRLMAAKYPYYILSDSPEGKKLEAELSGNVSAYLMDDAATVKPEYDIRQGFVYKRVPHVTLKAIANNEEIDEIHARWQPQLETARTALNAAVKQQWEEWDIPRETDVKWVDAAKKAHAEWWRLRRERQQEIDASIARRADTELLFDQPYEDNKKIRVTGPFTVESLSPHRVLAAGDDGLPASEAEGKQESAVKFETMILDNLKRSGVQNTVKQERLKFDTLEPHAGVWVNAVGDYTDADGKPRRVAVSIGPEHGTVGPEQVQEAAKEAVKGVGFDLLVVCGFAFDPMVSVESKQYGKLQVLITHMNPDLAMGDEVLKKTGAGNLFMVFGEPDIEIKPQKDGRIVVHLKGVDVYDPTTGAIRSHTTDEIACWFIDTAYNEESFFVRQAYFTGAGDPYDRLKRALRAEIDEEAWAALYSTKSYPFDPPKGKRGKPGKIAVKVINHYGDEVLKVCEVG